MPSKNAVQNNYLELDRAVTVCEGGVRLDGYVPHTFLSPDTFLGTLWARVRDLQNVYFSLRDGFPARARTHLSETTKELAINDYNFYQMPSIHIEKLFHCDGENVYPSVLL